MPLVDIEIPLPVCEPPDEVLEFLQEADSRVNRFLSDSRNEATSFVPCDALSVYRTLHTIAKGNLAVGPSFCEWGSGFGVVASLAAMLEFESHGIEIEAQLVEAARRLADDFDLPVEFVHGSLIPAGAEEIAEEAFADNASDEPFLLVTNADTAYVELGLDPSDFDLIFAYPWPSEDGLIAALFEEYAAEEALLLTYDHTESARLRRKAGRSSRRW